MNVHEKFIYVSKPNLPGNVIDLFRIPSGRPAGRYGPEGGFSQNFKGTPLVIYFIYIFALVFFSIGVEPVRGVSYDWFFVIINIVSIAQRDAAYNMF